MTRFHRRYAVKTLRRLRSHARAFRQAHSGQTWGTCPGVPKLCTCENFGSAAVFLVMFSYELRCNRFEVIHVFQGTEDWK